MMTQLQGAVPTTASVSRYLGDCGFKRSQNYSGGFRTGTLFSNTVHVTWEESLYSTERRMRSWGAVSAVDLPPLDEEIDFIDSYALALNHRYKVKVVDDRSLTVEQNRYASESRAGIPSLKKVRGLLEDHGIGLMTGRAESNRRGVASTLEWSCVRLMVRPWWGEAPWDEADLASANEQVADALRGAGFHICTQTAPEGRVFQVRNIK